MAAALFYWPRPQPVFPRVPLQDCGEFRVVQITYTARPCDSTDHNLGAARLQWRLYRRLPEVLQRRIPEPNSGIGGTSSTHPVLSIWWAHFEPLTRQPMLGKSGDVWMTEDSGQRTNLGWANPREDYRQIFVTDPPTHSKSLTFEFPIWDEQVRFRIDNPAYRP